MLWYIVCLNKNWVEPRSLPVSEVCLWHPLCCVVLGFRTFGVKFCLGSRPWGRAAEKPLAWCWVEFSPCFGTHCGLVCEGVLLVGHYWSGSGGTLASGVYLVGQRSNRGRPEHESKRYVDCQLGRGTWLLFVSPVLGLYHLQEVSLGCPSCCDGDTRVRAL